MIPFIESIKDQNDKRKYNTAYISLFGINNVHNLFRKILYAISFSSDAPSFFDSIYNISTSIPIVDNYAKAVKTLHAEIEKLVMNNSDFQKSIIFLDDLERLDNDIILPDFIGNIFNTLILELGLKVVFIGNEKEILKKEKSFSVMKEKVIRRTIYFKPNLNQQINQYLNKYYSGIKIKDYFIEQISLFTNAFDVSEFSNLRTIGFIFDQWKHIHLLKDENDFDQVKNKILKQLIIFSIEYNKGNLKYTEKDHYRNLYGILRTKEDDNDFDSKKNAINFSNMYLLNDPDKFTFLESIFDLVHLGILNKELFSNEIKSLQAVKSKKQKNLIDQILDYRKLEDEELISITNKILEASKLGNFLITQYPYLFSLLRHITQKYLNEADLICKYSDAVDQGIKQAIIPENFNYFIPQSITPYIEKDMNDRDFLEYKSYVIKTIKNTQKSESQNLVQRFISDIDELDHPGFIERFDNIKNENIFETIENLQLFDQFINMKNIGFERFRIILYNNFNNISNAGEFHYSEKKYLESLSTKINSYLEINHGLSKLRKAILMDFENDLLLSSRHLEKTKD